MVRLKVARTHGFARHGLKQLCGPALWTPGAVWSPSFPSCRSTLLSIQCHCNNLFFLLGWATVGVSCLWPQTLMDLQVEFSVNPLTFGLQILFYKMWCVEQSVCGQKWGNHARRISKITGNPREHPCLFLWVYFPCKKGTCLTAEEERMQTFFFSPWNFFCTYTY